MATRYGEGSIYQDKAKGLFYGTVELGRGPDGRRLRKKVSGKTKTEVRALLRQVGREVDDGTVELGPAMATGQWLDFWVVDWLPGKVAAPTEKFYRQVVRDWVKPYVGNVPLAKLTVEHVEHMMRALEAKGLSPRTQAMARGALRRALRIAEQRGRAVRNVAAISQAPKGAGSKVDDALDADEVGQVIQAAQGDRLEALAVLVVLVGLRQAEALDLRWDDVDLERGVLTVHGTKSKTSERTVALPGVVASALRRHRARQREERLAASLWADAGLVFTTSIGTRINGKNALAWWHGLTIRAGVGRRRFHASRHTAATLMLNDGVALEVVSATLGHASLAITADVYAKVRPELQRTAADAMDKRFGAGGGR